MAYHGLFGSAQVTLDAKSRISMPAAMRDPILRRCGGKFVMATHWMGVKSLTLYPEPVWEDFVAKLEELPAFDIETQHMVWRVMGQHALVDMDGQGRILIPSDQRQYAGLESQVWITGYGNRFELWEPNCWKQQQEEVRSREIPRNLHNLVLKPN